MNDRIMNRCLINGTVVIIIERMKSNERPILVIYGNINESF